MRSSLAAGARPQGTQPAARALLAALLLAAPMLLTAGGARGADDLILRVATDQKLETLNPWHSITVADYEIFQV
jgi:hypothetical protein